MNHRQKITLAFCLLLISSLIFLAFFIIRKQNFSRAGLLRPLVQAIDVIPGMMNVPSSPASDSLEQAVEGALVETTGTYGVVIKNLKTGESYSSNEHRQFTSASLYKLWVMAAVFGQIQNGQLDENETLSEDVAVLNQKFDIASESAELTEGTVTLTVKDALEEMITLSDNYAALLLSERIRLSSVSNFLAENDFHESTLGEPPITTASDIALFFEKLYQGELADTENTQKMLDLLKRQTLNNKLPKYLPAEVAMAHKTGEIEVFTHDAGIVYTNNGDYIIVVLSESDSPPDAEERIAGVSKAVYEYFTL